MSDDEQPQDVAPVVRHRDVKRICSRCKEDRGTGIQPVNNPKGYAMGLFCGYCVPLVLDELKLFSIRYGAEYSTNGTSLASPRGTPNVDYEQMKKEIAGMGRLEDYLIEKEW